MNDRIWKCKTCGLEFTSKAKLDKHRKESGEAQPRNMSKVCPLCGEYYTTTKRQHSLVCKAKSHGPHRWTEEEKKYLSEKRKKYLKEHPDEHPWKKSSKFKSEPCEHLKDILRQHGIFFLEEQSLVNIKENYSIDIVIPEIKLGIEVNGNQHYDTKTSKLKPYYQKRHDIIEAAGTKLLEIHYTKVYDNEFIMRLCSQLDDKLPSKQLCESLCRFESCQPYFDLKAKKEFLKKEKEQKALGENQIDATGKINRNVLPESELEKRKDLILNCGVDLKKFGWVDKVAKEVNLSRHQIKDVVNHFHLDVFRRKLSSS